MTPPQAPKKSESLEVRLSHAEKQRFMQRCQADGRTASEVVRDLINCKAELRPSLWSRQNGWQAAIAAAIGLVLGAIAAPSLAQTEGGSRAAFEKLDRNHDGVISRSEYQAR